MKKNILIIVSCFITWFSQAQNQIKEEKAIGKIYGQVVDRKTKTPIELATIVIHRQTDSTIVTGGTTDEKGNFTIESIPAGNYYVKISYIGYRQAISESLIITKEQKEKNYETINLASDDKLLNEIVIEGEKPAFENTVEKKVFNMEKNELGKGGSAIDVIQNIPSISVNQDNEISIRGGGNVLIYVNGKLTTLSLDQIPANMIEKVEVITSPSSKYDAEGMSGIINIVTKKNKLEGINSAITVGVGRRNKYNSTININYQKKNSNLYANYSIKWNDYFYNLAIDQENKSSLTHLNQNYTGLENEKNHMIQTGFDYTSQKNDKLSISINYTPSISQRTEPSETKFLDQNDQLTHYFKRDQYIERLNNSYQLDLTYLKTFQKPTHTLSTSFTAYKFNYSDNYKNEITNFNADGSPIATNPSLQEITEKGPITLLIGQLDYTNTLPKIGKIESGYKTTTQLFDNEFTIQSFDKNTQQWVKDLANSNSFTYHEYIHAGYVTLNNTYKKINYQAGIRSEYTHIQSGLQTTNTNFDRDYINFFPNASISYNLINKQTISLNYTRRINRPKSNELDPIKNTADPQNIRSGNPALNPERINITEINYSKNWTNTYFSASIYWRNIQDVIQRKITIDEKNVAYVTFENFDARNNWGSEWILKIPVIKGWDITQTLNVFHTKVQGFIQNKLYDNENTTFTYQISSSITIPRIAQLQLSGAYNAPSATPQGTLQPVYFLNAGLRKDILKNKGTISLNVSDIFNTRFFGVNINQADTFQASVYRKRESQIIMLSFSYRLGKMIKREQEKQSKPPADFDSF